MKYINVFADETAYSTAKEKLDTPQLALAGTNIHCTSHVEDDQNQE